MRQVASRFARSTSRFFACSRDSAGDGTIDAISLPERDLMHPIEGRGPKRDVAILFFPKPAASEQEASEERGAEDDLSVLTRIVKSSPGSAPFGV